MRVLLKVLNPFIWLWNFNSFCAHLETMRHCKVYERYDSSRELKYF